MEALLTGLVQNGPGAIMAGAVCLFTGRILTVTIPEREAQHREELASRDAAHAAAQESMRQFYASWLEAERSTFREALTKLEKNGELLGKLYEVVKHCADLGGNRREQRP